MIFEKMVDFIRIFDNVVIAKLYILSKSKLILYSSVIVSEKRRLVLSSYIVHCNKEGIRYIVWRLKQD